MEMTTQRIVMSKPHNHEPDRELLDVLNLRQRVLTAAETSTVKLSHVFNDATRGQEGACRFGYHPMSRTMQRWRRGKTPPPPLNALAADASLRDDKYKNSIYAKHYLGLVHAGGDYYALVFASRENLSKLGVDTKLIMC